MNATICPTVTALDPVQYRRQIEQLATFAGRVHIDLADGTLAPSQLLPTDEIWWPGGVRADIHCMYARPMDHLASWIAMQPQMIIVHAEAEGDFEIFSKTVRSHGIEAGVALLPTTPVELIRTSLHLIDHVLVFSGNFGSFGGKADPSLLPKVQALKKLKPQLEVGWDGGVNADNALALAQAGVDVLNVGGYIHGAERPAQAYRKLTRLIAGPKKRAKRSGDGKKTG